MASITIRNIDDDIKQALRIRASENGWSMEQEIRVLLEYAVSKNIRLKKQPLSFAERINERFKALDADDLVLPARQASRELPEI